MTPLIDRQTFGQYLGAVLRAKRIHPVVLAPLCGVSRRTIDNYLTDSTLPNDERLQKVCAVLELSHLSARRMFTPKRQGRPPKM